MIKPAPSTSMFKQSIKPIKRSFGWKKVKKTWPCQWGARRVCLPSTNEKANFLVRRFIDGFRKEWEIVRWILKGVVDLLNGCGQGSRTRSSRQNVRIPGCGCMVLDWTNVIVMGFGCPIATNCLNAQLVNFPVFQNVVDETARKQLPCMFLSQSISKCKHQIPSQ